MKTSEVCFLSAAEIGRLIKSREVSPVEVTQAYLERIDGLDERLHSYIMVANEEALRQAKEAEAQIASGQHKGPLHGVPLGIKDQCDIQGWPTTGGSTIFKDNVPDHDSTVAARLREAGAVFLGKLNMTELAIAETIDFPYGTPGNPWDLERDPGGSSAGSGAATAAFLCAASIGEDTGGSIRCPASYCGIAGMRPTWSRVSRHGLMSGVWSMDTLGPMARTVEDCALILHAIAGHDPQDPYSSKEPVPDYQATLDRPIDGLRVGLVSELIDNSQLDPDVVSAVRVAAEELDGLGAKVEEVSIPLVRDAVPLYWTVGYVEYCAVNEELIRTRAKDMTYMVKIRLLAASLLPGHLYYKALQLREALRRQVLAAFTRFDVLICPTMATGAPKPPTTRHAASKEEVSEALTGPDYLTAPFNLASVPALSVPCGFTSNNLPIGLQIAGRPFEDGTVLRVGHAYERATDWHTRRPPVS